MDNFNFNEFRADFEEAVKALEDKYGVDIKIGGITYSDHNFTARMTTTLKEIDGKSAEQVQFENMSYHYSMTPKDYLIKVYLDGRMFELYGLNPRARVKPYQIRDVKNGSTYKVTLPTLKMGVEAAKKVN